ncbi:hypothetical protein FRC14_004392 [Serendipita sp. 396]|nr:hypothetical protein FRC14_004392 [Serendipita sp. 396]
MAWHGKAPMAPYTILQRQRTIYDWRDPKLAVRFKSTPAYARACPTSSHLQPHTPLESLNFGSGSAPAYPRTGRRRWDDENHQLNQTKRSDLRTRFRSYAEGALPFPFNTRPISVATMIIQNPIYSAQCQSKTKKSTFTSTRSIGNSVDVYTREKPAWVRQEHGTGGVYIIAYCRRNADPQVLSMDRGDIFPQITSPSYARQTHIQK